MHDRPKYAPAEVTVDRRRLVDLEEVVGKARVDNLRIAADRLAKRLAGRTVWNVNSTPSGGGVAEMIPTLSGYAKDLNINCRWSVIGGDERFFAMTKQLIGNLYGQPSNGLTDYDIEHYEHVVGSNFSLLRHQIERGDLVILHDPQTAPLTRPLVQLGATVLWRCHVGVDTLNGPAQQGWAFLQDYVADAHGFIFSNNRYQPSWVPRNKAHIMPLSIDPLSVKNRNMSSTAASRILHHIGILGDYLGGTSNDGKAWLKRIKRKAKVIAEVYPTADCPLIVQISRWDHLKDMGGVMQSFAEHVVGFSAAYLALVGSAVDGVTDDPGAAEVYEECVAQWAQLPASARRRIMLVTLPFEDADENAIMINAFQRHSTIIAQKSLAEGFGLTVTEGMWKGRPIVGSAVGGILDQVVPGTGKLISNPYDLAQFGAALKDMINNTQLMKRLGQAAKKRVYENYLSDAHLLRYAALIESIS